MAERNLGFAEIFVMEVTYHRDTKVALMIWPYINSKVFSSIVYLLKIQNLTRNTIFSLDEPLIAPFIAKAALYYRDSIFWDKDELFGWS